MSRVDDILSFISRTLTDFVVAYLMAVIWGNTSAFAIAKIILAIKLNVFAIPLMGSPVLDLPLWIYYIVFVMWIMKWVHLSPYTVGEIMRQIEADIAYLRTSNDQNTSEEVISDD